MDLVEATVFFAREDTKFRVPERRAPDINSDDKAPGDALDDVFIIGLEPKRRYHVETGW